MRNNPIWKWLTAPHQATQLEFIISMLIVLCIGDLFKWAMGW